MNQIERIIENCKRTRHETHTAACAIELVTKKKTYSLCCWCLDKADPNMELGAHRVYLGGDCDRCPYSGYDCLVVCTSEDSDLFAPVVMQEAA